MTATTDKNYRAIGTAAILKHLRRFQKEAAGVLENRDAECIHRMRVASRRLRCCLKTFAKILPPKARKMWARQIAKTGRALGKARDVDVQIVTIDKFRKDRDLQSHRHAIQNIHSHLRNRRISLQPKVKRAILRLEKSQIIPEIESAMRRIRRQADFGKKSVNARRMATKIIADSCEKMTRLSYCVSDPQKTEELHRLRVAARKLRYTLEIFTPIMGASPSEIVNDLAEIQETLGAIHDCDVWIDFLPDFGVKQSAVLQLMQRRKKTPRTIGDGIKHLRTKMVARRKELHDGFVAKWELIAIAKRIKTMLANASAGSESKKVRKLKKAIRTEIVS